MLSVAKHQQLHEIGRYECAFGMPPDPSRCSG
jgi:hypothetical protein